MSSKARGKNKPAAAGASEYTFADLVEHITLIGKNQFELDRLQALYNQQIAILEERIATLREQHAKAAAPILKELFSAATDVYAYASKHRPTLAADSNSVQLMTHDCVRWAQNQASVVIAPDKEKSVLAWLREHKPDCVRTKYEIKKTIIRELPQEELQSIPDVSLEQRERFEIITADAKFRLTTYTNQPEIVWEVRGDAD